MKTANQNLNQTQQNTARQLASIFTTYGEATRDSQLFFSVCYRVCVGFNLTGAKKQKFLLDCGLPHNLCI